MVTKNNLAAEPEEVSSGSLATTVEGASVLSTASASPAPPTLPRSWYWWKAWAPKLAITPFFAYTAIFLFLPTTIVIIGAFQDQAGYFTLANFAKLNEANTLDALFTSLWVSFISALVGAIVGGLAAYVLVEGAQKSRLARQVVTALSSVLAQFGGVMLAFAFIATIGINGVLTQGLHEILGVQVDPNWISSLPGLITIYSYFQIPLMIIVFIPAIDALRPQWREASENLGGSTLTYWLRVGLPVLWPAWAGSFLLLFANAFSAFATAAALFSQRSILIPLMIQSALRNEQDLSQTGFAQVLAFMMVGVVAVVMSLYAILQKRALRWQQ